MVKIAICEDNAKESALLKTIVKTHFGECSAEEFETGESLLDYLKENSPDIILLDIEMPGINGVEAARKIREVHPFASIIFITGHPQFALEAFEVYAFDYIVKPVDGERLINSLNKITGVMRREERYIDIRSRGMIFRVREGDIYFIEKVYNKCCVYTRDHTYTAVRTLKSFERELDGRLFIKTHNAFLVNKEKIAGITTRRSQNYEIHFHGLDKKALLSRGANKKLCLV